MREEREEIENQNVNWQCLLTLFKKTSFHEFFVNEMKCCNIQDAHFRRKFAGYACANFMPNGNAGAMSAREAWAMPVPVLVLVEALERARRNFFFPLMGLFLRSYMYAD